MDYMFFVCSYMDRKFSKKYSSLEKLCFDTFEYLLNKIIDLQSEYITIVSFKLLFL